MNRATFIGNAAQDPEVRSTQSGIQVCNFTVAVRRRFKNQNGEYETDFFRCVAWRGQAEYVGKYLRKGSRVAVSGELHRDRYTGSDAVQHENVELVVDEIQIIEPRSGSGTQQSAEAEFEEARQKYAPDVPMVEVEDEELPF